MNFFESLTTFTQVLWIIAAPASAVYIVMAIATFMGMDGSDGLEADFDGDLEIDDTASEGSGFQVFTFRNVLAFLIGIGWGGLAFYDNGYSQTYSIVGGVIVGAGFTVLQSSLFYFMYKFNSPNEPEIKSAVGLNGKVYLKVPKNAEGFGKIQLTHNDTMKTVNALTYHGTTIAKGRLVEVIDVEGDNLVVIPKSKSLKSKMAKRKG